MIGTNCNVFPNCYDGCYTTFWGLYKSKDLKYPIRSLPSVLRFNSSWRRYFINKVHWMTPRHVNCGQFIVKNVTKESREVVGFLSGQYKKSWRGAVSNWRMYLILKVYRVFGSGIKEIDSFYEILDVHIMKTLNGKHDSISASMSLKPRIESQ